MEESMGAVLGANVMRDHNVVFDFDNHRVGFAEGICDYKADRKDDAEGNGSKVCEKSKMQGSKFLLEWISFLSTLVS